MGCSVGAAEWPLAVAVAITSTAVKAVAPGGPAYRAGLRAGDRVLDVACGTGVVAIAAAHRVGARGTVTGVDVSSGMLAVAQRVADEAGVPTPIAWELGSAEQLDAVGGYDATPVLRRIWYAAC